jgi:hypothetical protein
VLLTAFWDSQGILLVFLNEPQGYRECILLLHNTVAPEGNYFDKMPWPAHRESDASPWQCPTLYIPCYNINSWSTFTRNVLHTHHTSQTAPTDVHLFRLLEKHFEEIHY